MTKKKSKQVVDVKGQEEKEDKIQVVSGNTGALTVQFLAAILAELKKINGRPE